MIIHKAPAFLAKYMLVPSQPECLLFILFFLVVCRKCELAFKTLLFVAFCIVVNAALKVTFQVPSYATSAKGHFAFPSGHMQFSTVFYGWIIYHLRHDVLRRRIHGNKNENTECKIDSFKTYLLYSLLMLILFIVGYGLVLAEYHSMDDVIAGWIVGTLLVCFIGAIELVIPRYVPIFVTSIASACMIYIPFQYAPIPEHAWWAYGIVLLLSLHWICTMHINGKTRLP